MIKTVALRHIRTPGRFHTRIAHRGTETPVPICYRAAKVKRYFRAGHNRRTETTINNTRGFGVGRPLTDQHCNALIDVGHQINRRLLDHQVDACACACAPDATTLGRVVRASTTPGCLPAPGLRFGEPRTMALLAPMCSFEHMFAGLTKRTLRELIGLIPGYSAPEVTFDLGAPTPQRVHPAHPPHPVLRADPRGAPTGRLVQRERHADRQPTLARLDPVPQPSSPPDHHSPTRGAFERAIEHPIRDAALAAWKMTRS